MEIERKRKEDFVCIRFTPLTTYYYIQYSINLVYLMVILCVINMIAYKHLQNIIIITAKENHGM